MKLYTAEQVLKFINDNFDEGCSGIIGLTPIELPSEEDIDIISKEEILYNDSKRAWWVDGAKWVIEQIKQQDNGN